ncbi:MAG: glycoside hydrolase family 18 protein [Bacteroidales bacterium]|nr:glycoside hydrolase family 18 protein [Bacteroidales bacterium]
MMQTKIFIILTALSLGMWQCESPTNNTENQEKQVNKKEPIVVKEYKTIAYVAGFRDFDFSTIQAEKISHINYAFANIIDGKVAFGGKTAENEAALKDSDIASLHRLKEVNPNLKVLVSVGGWTWSTHFSEVASTKGKREIFARSAVDFLLKYNLDGIDVDWEYPNQSGAGNPHSLQDIENSTLLLKEMRVQLDAQSVKDNRPEHDKYLLTIATGGDKAFVENTRLGEAHKYLDFINIMTYDFYNGWHHTTGHHANLTVAENDPADELKSVLTSVKGHVDAGVPIGKINLGIPFYGRKWEGVEAVNNGLFQKAETVGMIEYYRIIAQDCLKNSPTNGYQQFWDSSAQVPYLWNEKERIFISYENQRSIKLKIDYLKKAGIGGVMFWEYSDDYQSELLDAVYKGLK